MGGKIQTIKDIRFYLAKELQDLYNEAEIRAIANLLIKTVTGATKLHQFYDNGYTINDSEAGRFISIAEELKTGRPVQYILGQTIFYDCIIKVDSSTLIPRPETEELVRLILMENKGFTGNIIDFGSGSGCISIALAANLPDALITGIEFSGEAVRIARENAVLNEVKVSFLEGDIFSLERENTGTADIIVSNPPYVRNSEKTLMSKNVLDFEPPLALFVSDSDPLIYYKAILKIARYALLPGGRLYFEINEAMGRQMVNLLESFDYSVIEVVNDINGKERFIKGRKNV